MWGSSQGFFTLRNPGSPLDSYFPGKEVQCGRWALQTRKTQSLLGMPCTGIRNPGWSCLFIATASVTNANCPSPQDLGKARGRRGQSEGGSHFFGWPKAQQGIKLSYFQSFNFLIFTGFVYIVHICFCRQCCFFWPVKTTGLHITHSSLWHVENTYHHLYEANSALSVPQTPQLGPPLHSLVFSSSASITVWNDI